MVGVQLILAMLASFPGECDSRPLAPQKPDLGIDDVGPNVLAYLADIFRTKQALTHLWAFGADRGKEFSGFCSWWQRWQQRCPAFTTTQMDVLRVLMEKSTWRVCPLYPRAPLSPLRLEPCRPKRRLLPPCLGLWKHQPQWRLLRCHFSHWWVEFTSV